MKTDYQRFRVYGRNDGSESCTSYKQVLFFKDVGFNVETMIWEKTGAGCLGSNPFYGQNA